MSTFPALPDTPQAAEPTPDPGSRLAAKVAWVAVIVLMAIVVTLNQLPEKEPAKAGPAAAKAVEPPEVGDQFALAAKFIVKLSHAWSIDAASRQRFVASLDDSAQTDADKVRVAIVAANLIDPQAGIDRLDKIPDLTGPLAEDAQDVKASFESDTPPSASVENRLVEHHGWFGKLAATRTLPDTDPKRAAVLAGANRILLLLIAFTAVLFVGGLGGLVAFVWMLVLLGGGRIRPRFVAPAPGGSAFIETVPIFILAFLLLHLGLGLLAHAKSVNGEPPDWLMPFQLCAQWSLIVIPLWPLVRGMKWTDFRTRLGWHSGQGVFREIGAGIAAYFASLPLLVVMAAITIAIMMVKAAIYERMHPGKHAAPPSNHIAELIGNGSPAVLVLLFVLATLWAPIVEEAIFRGSMYRQLRSRLGMLAAAVLSALTFGLMHGYPLLLLGPVICLGFVFALMREWRGSLIPSMTAHFLHNATVLSLAILALSAVRN